MIRAVLDTNVLAAGLVGLEMTTSAPGVILSRWLAGAGAGPVELVVSSHIMEELERALTKPYFDTRRSRPQIESTQSFIESVATFVEPTEIVSGVAPHPEDDLVFSAAVSAGADYLVTGDKAFLAIGAYAGVTILSPRAFLDVLEAENS